MGWETESQSKLISLGSFKTFLGFKLSVKAFCNNPCKSKLNKVKSGGVNITLNLLAFANPPFLDINDFILSMLTAFSLF